jgi:pimeloyl-ACP methyl ester carboxylesterase
MNITQHFITVGSRRVHYLRSGQGPAVCMLHASPCSSKVMRPLMAIFSQHFTCLAFDTPGFGLSDPLPLASPSVEDFADALAETLSALGIEQVATYGRHTGASIAVEFAARHPARCSMALADGFAVFAAPYTQEELDLYLEPIVAQWDGAHLLRLWFRYRDQHVFWPWNKQLDTHRSDTDVPDLDFLHRGVVELLQAGNGYRVGYAAPFRHRALGVVDDLKVPVCFGNRAGDSMYLTRHLYPEGLWMSDVPRDFEAASAHEVQLLRTYPASGVVPEPPACQALDGRLNECTLSFEGVQLAIRWLGDIHARTPVLLLHHAPGSCRLYEKAMLSIGLEHPIVSFDLPGHGESDPLSGNPQDHDTWRRAAGAVIDHLGVEQMHVWGHQGGAALACAIACVDPGRVASVVLDAPLWVGEPLRTALLEQGIPDVTPSAEGAHWLRAWHHARDSELWWPWFDKRHANKKNQASQIDPEHINARVLHEMKQPASFKAAWVANWTFDWAASLDLLKMPVMCLSADNDTFAHLCQESPHSSIRPVSCKPQDHSAALCRWWSTVSL